MTTFLTESNLKEAIKSAEAFSRPFQANFNEEERIAAGKPGRVPKGKPRVTDGTVAAIVKEGPKRVVQQLPTGKVRVKNFPELETQVNAILTDDILRNAKSGGSPRTKAKNGVKRALTTGKAFAYCFYNKRGDWFGADFKLINPRDIRFEQGKTSEFDANTMFMDGWYTVSDLKAIRDEQVKHSKNAKTRNDDYEAEWVLDVLDELIEGGESPKDDQNKSLTEKVVTTEDNGFIKLTHCFQVGVNAKWYTYSEKLDKVAKVCVNKDPRGIIPIHELAYEEDDANPYGQSLVSLSAGKQNLLDFEMQMHQYQIGYSLSPTVLNYGSIQKSKIKLIPDNIINMGPKSAGNEITAMKLDTMAGRDFAGNYGLLKSQILNETGMTSDTSVSSQVGNPGFSKTDAGVDALQARLGVSDNDIRKNVEDWLGRIYETLLNIHFAYNKGTKEVELMLETAKRMKLEPGAKLEVDYDADYGKIDFVVDAGTTETADNEKENERLVDLLELTSQYGGLRPDKQMGIINQIIQNSGMDDPERFMYSDEEIQQAQIQQDQANAAATVDPMNTEADPNEQAATPEELQEPPQQQLSEEEVQAAEMLTQRGYDQESVATALTMLRNGYSDEEISQVLAGVNQ